MHQMSRCGKRVGLGGGNTVRNPPHPLPNYLYDEKRAGIYDHALKLWDGLGAKELNYNVSIRRAAA